MHGHPRPVPYLYNTSPYGIPAYGTVSYQAAPLDIHWYRIWPSVRTVLLSVTMLICSAAVISLDIANVAIEGNKQNGTSKLGSGPGKVGAGIWTGSISLISAVLVLVIIFKRNKRTAATFALLAVVLAFFFIIALVGLSGNAVQNDLQLTNRTGAEQIQDKLLIAIFSIASFMLILCIIFFIMYIRIFFSPLTRPSTRR